MGTVNFAMWSVISSVFWSQAIFSWNHITPKHYYFWGINDADLLELVLGPNLKQQRSHVSRNQKKGGNITCKG